MITLNLIDLEKSDIKYKISQFPDRQQNIVIKDNYIENLYNYSIKIISRLNNWFDLELIVCTVACLKELNVEKIHLYTPYFVGARSDRKFEDGGNWYLKQVICPVINSLNLASITVLDPHSWVLGNLLNNFKYIDNENLVTHFAIPEIIKEMKLPAITDDKYHVTPKGLHYDKRGFDNLILISPDAGASHKVEKIAKALGYTKDIITCNKERDTQGNLTKTVVPLNTKLHADKDFIIVDDICDGGRTFTNIADNIKQNGYIKNKIYLVITHGIFSAGFEELTKYFDSIYCTNSYSNIGDLQGNNLQKTKTKQLNVY